MQGHRALPSILLISLDGRQTAMQVTWNIVLVVLMICNVYNPVVATCTPFNYVRGSACLGDLAASTFPSCSSMNLTTELDICKLQFNDDLEYLGSVARVLGKNMVNIKSDSRQ